MTYKIQSRQIVDWDNVSKSMLVYTVYVRRYRWFIFPYWDIEVNYASLEDAIKYVERLSLILVYK